MPATQSTTPDIYLKTGSGEFQVVYTEAEAPTWATVASLVLRPRGGTSITTHAGGTVATGVVTIEIDTTSLAPGLYDGEWAMTDGSTKDAIVPASTYLTVEVVEKLQ